jgi:hypothetical protein
MFNVMLREVIVMLREVIVMLREVAASSVCELNFLAVDYKHKQIWILRLRAE